MRSLFFLALLGLLLAGCGGGTPSGVTVRTGENDTKSLTVNTSKQEKTWYGRNAQQWLAILRGTDDNERSRAAGILAEAGVEVVPDLIESLSDANPKVRAYADITLVRIGSPAIPAILQALKNQAAAESGRNVLARIVESQPPSLKLVADGLRDPSAAVRGNVAQVLRKLGPGASSVSGDLLKALQDQDEDVRGQVAQALESVGISTSDALSLINYLKDANPTVRVSLVQIFGGLKALPTAAVPDLVKILRDDLNDGARAAASQALGKAGASDSVTVVPLLCKSLAEDKSSQVRSRAAASLGNLKAKTAIPDLVLALKDQDSGVRQSAATSLGGFRADAAPAVKDLANLLSDQASGPRLAAIGALARLAGDNVPGALAGLVQAVRDQDERVRETAITALIKVGGPETAAAVPPIVQVLKDPKTTNQNRKRMVDMLIAVGPPAKAAVPALADLLKEEDAELRLNAAKALGKIGPAAVEALTQGLQNESDAVRGAAAHGLVEAGPAGKDAVPILAGLVSEKDEKKKSSLQTRQNAVAALLAIGGEARSAAPVLAAAAREVDLRKEALLALQKIGAPAVDPLIDLIQDKATTSTLRSEAFATFKNMGQLAVPGLVRILEDKNSNKEMRETAIKTLGALAKAAEPALPALKEAAKDSDKDIARAASEALKKIGG